MNIRFALKQSGIKCLVGLLLLLSPGFSPAYALVVKKLQFQESPATTRIILDLTSTPKDLVVRDPSGKPMTVTFRGKIAGGFKSQNKQYEFPNLKGVYVSQHNGKVQVFIKRYYKGTVAVDAEANRLIVTIPHQKTDAAHKHSAPAPIVPVAMALPATPVDMPLKAVAPTPAAGSGSVDSHSNSSTLADGVRHYRLTQRTAAGPARVNVIEIDPKSPGIEIMPALASNRMGAKANVARIVSNNQAVAGINGSFFKQDKGIPLGVLMINQELVSGPIYDRVALGITLTNDLVMERVRLAGEAGLPDGRKIRLHNINQPRVNPAHTVVYTSRWGTVAPKVPANGLQILLQGGRVMGVSNSDPLSIPRDGVVISGPATAEMQALASGGFNQPVALNIYTLPDWSGMKHAIGGGPYLVKNGRQFVDVKAEHFSGLGFREPRSAVGITQDGKLLLVTVDGRRKGVSAGMTLHEMAYLMQRLGCVQAMNLDGGSSTQMAIHGKMINLPSSGGIGVSNSLIVRKTADGNMALERE